MNTDTNAALGTLGALVRCDQCDRYWPAGCEQAVAIRKRGKCIVCLVEFGEHFSMDPYEFPSDPDYTPNAPAHLPPASGGKVPPDVGP